MGAVGAKNAKNEGYYHTNKKALDATLCVIMRITAAHTGYEHECSRKNVTDNVKPAVEHYRDMNIIGVVKVEADVVHYHTEYAEASNFVHKACTSVFF